MVETAFARALNQQPAPAPITPRIVVDASTPLPAGAVSLTQSFFAPGIEQSSLEPLHRARTMMAPSIDYILGLEASTRATTDGGSLLDKSPAAVGIGVQKRTPVVNDPRVRGCRVGSLFASGSHWVPARIDLDTMLSKIDSRWLQDVVVIKGPYSAQYGPGFEFIDFQLLGTPRYECGYESHGSTGVEYRFNGEQVYGHQSLWGGNEDWGYRVAYGHRTGNDYRAGNGVEVPASYNSRFLDVTIGRDVGEDGEVEFTYLRLDQTNVEYPGQAFDMDFLVTDGFDLSYRDRGNQWFDQFDADVWYNRTRFQGDTRNPSKHAQFPFYDFLSFVGDTDVNSSSLGYKMAWSWGDIESSYLTVGTDLRYVKQELNEISSGTLGFSFWFDANSPIPESDQLDPGIFAEYTLQCTDRVALKTGVRADFVESQITDDPAKLAAVGTNDPQSSYAEIVGTDEFDQSFSLLSAYVTGNYQVSPCMALNAGVGYAERPPTLTELYAAESFMFLLQSGLNTVTGDPRLKRERNLQVDASVNWDNGFCRAGLSGFHSWRRDYITFENLRVAVGQHGNNEQSQLKYVNTDRATLFGGEFYAELDANDWLSPFATVSYVAGRDLDRNGNFATRQSSGAGDPSTQVAGLPRGDFSGISGGETESLPGISPLESRIGVRIHEPHNRRRWAVELSARVVDNQDRVARSLLETPTPGFTVWDLRGYWQATDSFLVIAGVENFTDKTYREHLDFRNTDGIQLYQQGIAFYLSTELTY